VLKMKDELLKAWNEGFAVGTRPKKQRPKKSCAHTLTFNPQNGTLPDSNVLLTQPATEGKHVSVLDDLSALQELDGEIRELERQVNDIPVRREQEIQKLTTEQDDLNRAREEVNRLILEARADEMTISEIKETITRYRTQQMSLKTNAEYAAMNSQIAQAEEAEKAAEAKLAEDKAKIPVAEAAAADFQAAYDAAKSEVDAYVADLDARLAETQQRLDDARQRRAAMAAPLDVPATRKFLMYYERLRKSRWPVLIQLDAGVCTGCHMQLPPAKQQDTVRNAGFAADPAKMTIVSCDFCGRMIY
jgi:predicted  nucleic acid-binding Zn-ribbon protein